MNKYWIHSCTGQKAELYALPCCDDDKGWVKLIKKEDSDKVYVNNALLLKISDNDFNNYWIPITKAEYDSTLTLEEIKRNRNIEGKENMKDTFESLCQEMIDVHKAKNHDYGNSFHNLFKELGINYAYGHLKEKLERIKTLKDNEAKVKSESMIDSLKDLANYAIMTIIELQNSKKN